jgi:hypothetical protein
MLLLIFVYTIAVTYEDWILMPMLFVTLLRSRYDGGGLSVAIRGY